MNIAVIGLGHFGLPTASLLARCGHRVYGYDVNGCLRRSLQRGHVSTTEGPVKEAAEQALASGRLHVVDGIPSVQAYILCVPSPTQEGTSDLRYVEAAAAGVAAAAEPGSILVLESTVPPGATERIFERALSAAGKQMRDFRIAHCPERVIPGAIMDELRTNGRVVGGRTAADAEAVKNLYASFCEGPIAVTSLRTAEFVKIAENTFRDVNIALANELAVVSEELGVDVWETIELANEDPRINILQPGPGVRERCMPLDPHFLSDANLFATELALAARRVNDRMPHRLVRRIAELVEPERGHKIALLGAAYRADVDDAESPAVSFDGLLRERGYTTAIYDPHVAQFHSPLCMSLEEAATGADAIVLIAPHSAFRSIRPAAMAALMRTPRMIDTRRFFDAREWEACGFACYLLGSPFKRMAARAVA